MPTLDDLLGPRARVIHTKRKLNIQKRIVEFDGQKYVLHRFLRKKLKERFGATVRRMQERGAPVQSIYTQTSSLPDVLRSRGHWLVLSFVPGKPISHDAHPRVLAALGRTLATLNSIQGAAHGALFDRRTLALPHETFLARQAHLLSCEEKRWVEASLARMRQLPDTQLVHGDLQHPNILTQDDGSVSLIDYELMGYDISGIELAEMLLHPSCRQTVQRASLLASYIAACPAELRGIWQTYALDLLFSATARLLNARQDKIGRGMRRDRFWARLEMVTPRPWRAAVEKKRAELAHGIAGSKKREAYYLGIARKMVALALADPGMDPVLFLDKCDPRTGRKAG